MEGVMQTDGGTIVRLCDRPLVDPVLGDGVEPTLTSAKHERLRDSIEPERFRNQSLLLQRRQMELDCLKERQEFNYSKQLIHVPQINGDEMKKRKKKLRAQAQ
jgi:hypothetical protein